MTGGVVQSEIMFVILALIVWHHVYSSLSSAVFSLFNLTVTRQQNGNGEADRKSFHLCVTPAGTFRFSISRV